MDEVLLTTVLPEAFLHPRERPIDEDQEQKVVDDHGSESEAGQEEGVQSDDENNEETLDSSSLLSDAYEEDELVLPEEDYFSLGYRCFSDEDDEDSFALKQLADLCSHYRSELERERSRAERLEKEVEEWRMRKAASPLFFAGRTFMVTAASRWGRDYTPRGGRFHKAALRATIIAKGGRIVEDVMELAAAAAAGGSNGCSAAFLISDDHYRTHKYLAALAAGVPCLSHGWIEACCRAEQLLQDAEYRLPAGRGLLDGVVHPQQLQQQLLQQPMTSTMTMRGALLEGRRILLHSRTVTIAGAVIGFKDIWRPILSLLGAAVVSDERLLQQAEGGGDGLLFMTTMMMKREYDMVITDATCCPGLASAAAAAGKPVVSSEWLVQSIITGRMPAYDAHPRFRHDYFEE